jgi:hypothetical protein
MFYKKMTIEKPYLNDIISWEYSRCLIGFPKTIAESYDLLLYIEKRTRE